MNIYGERYANHHRFVTYCRELNVETSGSELENYEKIGAMLPVARLVYPDKYIFQEYENRQRGQQCTAGLDEWQKLTDLSEGFGPFPFGFESLADEQLVHCYDREMDSGQNPHIFRPDGVSVQPWDEYRVKVHNKNGFELKQPTAEHFYSYWQAHQLFYIQDFPDLYKNKQLIEHIPQEVKEKLHLPRQHRTELLADFKGMRRLFDVLSFWIVVYTRERGRTFARIPERNGIRTLSRAQLSSYRKRLDTDAKMVMQRFKLDRESLYGFLRQLLVLSQSCSVRV